MRLTESNMLLEEKGSLSEMLELNKIYNMDCLKGLKQLPDNSINCCVTSPPYWGLRDYGVEGQLGLEKTPEEYVSKMVEIFREVRRVLRDDGTLWLNLGDSYAGNCSQASNNGRAGFGNPRERLVNRKGEGLKPKDLVGIPWMVAFALRADGWYLRQDIIWHKPNPLPESVKDRCTKSHEYIFLLAKSAQYYYDNEAIKEKAVSGTDVGILRSKKQATCNHPSILKRQKENIDSRTAGDGNRNKRSVWTITTKPFKEAHFAVFPPELPEICIKAGCPEGGTVLDPFAGAGTTLYVAEQLGRNSIGIELNPDYCDIIRRRMAGIEPNLFEGVK